MTSPDEGSQNNISPLLEPLNIPTEYARYNQLAEVEVLTRLEQWKRKTHAALLEIKELVVVAATCGGKTTATSSPKVGGLSVGDKARIVAAVAPFDGDGPWVASESRDVTKEILSYFSNPSKQLLETILTHHVKALFKFNPHPSLNLSTGRKLPQPAGGPMASQDYYEGQVWKTYPGASNLVSWIIRNTQTEAYESLWHHIIPSLMTFLDDYEAPYKLRGINMVSEMLKRVPKELLKRTGVDGLLFNSLTISLTNLHNPLSPSIIRAAVPTTLTLIDLSAPLGSQARFDKLCALLGDFIIGNVWLYASMEPESVQASLDVLPGVMEKLGIGCARYLKALIPQLSHPLLSSQKTASKDMQLASIVALDVLIDICAPRMYRWKGTILDAVAKCWVGFVDFGADDADSRAVKNALRKLCSKLAEVCPSVVQEEYARLLALDANMFGELVGHGELRRDKIQQEVS